MDHPERNALRFLWAVLLAATVSGCAETQLAIHAAKEFVRKPDEAQSTMPAQGRTSGGGVYKVGNPYEVAGVWYYPKVDPEYAETGIASWYGHPFHGRDTANGEVYDMNAITAAHKTLPMPTYVRVTNLENGRTLVVRVNDRGPFVNGRIIDLSRRSAQLLGFEQQGTARVKVEAIPSPEEVRIAEKPETPPEVRTAVAAAPVQTVSAEALAPPPGMNAAEARPRPRDNGSSVNGRVAAVQTSVTASGTDGSAPSGVDVVPVKPTEIYIQAGAFSFVENARLLQNRLGDVSGTSISRAHVNGQEFFRVRIGPLRSVDEADAALSDLIAKGHTNARIVVD